MRWRRLLPRAGSFRHDACLTAGRGRNLPGNISAHRDPLKMRSLFAVIAAFALLYTGAAVAQSVGQFPFALTREGQMLGAVRGEVASFKGLAYAAPPVGSLR